MIAVLSARCVDCCAVEKKQKVLLPILQNLDSESLVGTIGAWKFENRTNQNKETAWINPEEQPHRNAEISSVCAIDGRAAWSDAIKYLFAKKNRFPCSLNVGYMKAKS